MSVAEHEIFQVQKFNYHDIDYIETHTVTIVTDTLGTSTIDKLEVDSFYFYAGELILSFKQCNLQRV